MTSRDRRPREEVLLLPRSSAAGEESAETQSGPGRSPGASTSKTTPGSSVSTRARPSPRPARTAPAPRSPVERREPVEQRAAQQHRMAPAALERRRGGEAGADRPGQPARQGRRNPRHVGEEDEGALRLGRDGREPRAQAGREPLRMAGGVDEAQPPARPDPCGEGAGRRGDRFRIEAGDQDHPLRRRGERRRQRAVQQHARSVGRQQLAAAEARARAGGQHQGGPARHSPNSRSGATSGARSAQSSREGPSKAGPSRAGRRRGRSPTAPP